MSSYYEGYYSFQKLQSETSLKCKIKNIAQYFVLSNIPLSLKSFVLNCFFNNEDDFKIKSIVYLNPNKNWDILDVGCGSGDFIFNLHEVGFKGAVGIDPFITDSIQYNNGAKVIKSDLFNVCNKYDLITFHHSFEHLIDPIKFIEKIAHLLKPKGVCLIRLPSIDCLSYKIFKEYWVGIHAPYHIFLPSYKAMEILLKQFGLKIHLYLGEQIMDFFLMSKENFMGINGNQHDSIRSIVKEKGDIKFSPWHCEKELAYWKSMKKLVEKNNMCDCVAYYITHE